MVDAGEPDHTIAAEPSWSLTIALAAVIVVALLAGVFALADGGSGATASADGGREPSAAPPTSTTTSPMSTTTTSTTTASTSTTTFAVPTTLPPIEPVLIPPATVVAPWAADGFTVAFPSEPRVGSVPVSTASGTVTRSEYDLDGPDGSVLSVTAVDLASTGQPATVVLADVAQQVGRHLGAPPIVDAPTTVGGQPAMPFRVSTVDGVVRAVVVHGVGRLYTVSMFTPGSGPTSAADAVFDQLVASFQLV